MAQPDSAQPQRQRTPLTADEKLRAEANFSPYVAQALAAKGRFRVTADTPESQEICFVPTGDYRDLLRTRLSVHPALEPGEIVTRDGEVVGHHEGYGGFTVGQRRGLGGGFGEAHFVLEIRPETRQVVVGRREELLQDEVVVSELNWLGEEPAHGEVVQVQMRYRAHPVGATVGEAGEGLRLELAEPTPAITPGQSAVVFDGARLRGGGRIVCAGNPC